MIIIIIINHWKGGGGTSFDPTKEEHKDACVCVCVCVRVCVSECGSVSLDVFPWLISHNNGPVSLVFFCSRS